MKKLVLLALVCFFSICNKGYSNEDCEGRLSLHSQSYLADQIKHVNAEESQLHIWSRLGNVYENKPLIITRTDTGYSIEGSLRVYNDSTPTDKIVSLTCNCQTVGTSVSKEVFKSKPFSSDLGKKIFSHNFQPCKCTGKNIYKALRYAGDPYIGLNYIDYGSEGDCFEKVNKCLSAQDGVTKKYTYNKIELTQLPADNKRRAHITIICTE